MDFVVDFFRWAAVGAAAVLVLMGIASYSLPARTLGLLYKRNQLGRR